MAGTFFIFFEKPLDISSVYVLYYNQKRKGDTKMNYTYWKSIYDGRVERFYKGMSSFLLINGWERITKEEYDKYQACK